MEKEGPVEKLPMNFVETEHPSADFLPFFSTVFGKSVKGDHTLANSAFPLINQKVDIWDGKVLKMVSGHFQQS